MTRECKIEEGQLGRVKRLEACLVIDLVVAWRIFHLTELGREVPNVSCTIFFEEAEWKALVGSLTDGVAQTSCLQAGGLLYIFHQ